MTKCNMQEYDMQLIYSIFIESKPQAATAEEI